MGVFDILFAPCHRERGLVRFAVCWCTAYFTKIFQKSEKIVIMVTRRPSVANLTTTRRSGKTLREVAEWIIIGSVNSTGPSSNRLGQFWPVPEPSKILKCDRNARPGVVLYT